MWPVEGLRRCNDSAHDKPSLQTRISTNRTNRGMLEAHMHLLPAVFIYRTCDIGASGLDAVSDSQLCAGYAYVLIRLFESRLTGYEMSFARPCRRGVRRTPWRKSRTNRQECASRLRGGRPPDAPTITQYRLSNSPVCVDAVTDVGIDMHYHRGCIGRPGAECRCLSRRQLHHNGRIALIGDAVDDPGAPVVAGPAGQYPHLVFKAFARCNMGFDRGGDTQCARHAILHLNESTHNEPALFLSSFVFVSTV